MKCSILSREEAKEQGFAVYTGGTHICIDVPKFDQTSDGQHKGFTLTVKAPGANGPEKIKLGFSSFFGTNLLQSVDIIHDNDNLNKYGDPVQDVRLDYTGGTIKIPKDSGSDDRRCVLTTLITYQPTFTVKERTANTTTIEVK